MNIKSKFTWGHIIAFVALILISFGTFMGAAYSANGKLIKAGFEVLSVDVLLLIFTIGPQMMKGTGAKHYKSLRPIEKTLLYLSPVAFIVLMMLPISPFTHFANVLQHKTIIEQRFADAIVEADNMFEEYDVYSKARIAQHNEILELNEAKFSPREIASRKKALNLLLLPSSYTDLRNGAKNWITNSCNGATIWNVFTIGNMSGIEDAVQGWHAYLQECSKRNLSSETDIVTFDTECATLRSCQTCISDITETFSQNSFNIIAILLCILLYGMMLLPYMLQERDSIPEIIERNKQDNRDVLW